VEKEYPCYIPIIQVGIEILSEIDIYQKFSCTWQF